MIGREGGIPLYVQVREALRKEIESMTPGSMIETEPQLEKRFAVSRVTVRKALDDLVSDGLLVRQQGRGTFVREPKLTHRLDSISSWTEQLKALGYVAGTVGQRVEEIIPPKRIAGLLGLDSDARVYKISRVRLANGEPISIMFNYLDAEMTPDLATELLRGESLYEVLEQVYGLVPHNAVDTVEAREATEHEAELLKIEPWAPVICVTRISYLATRRPLEVASAISRADRYQYQVVLSGRNRTGLDPKHLVEASGPTVR